MTPQQVLAYEAARIYPKSKRERRVCELLDRLIFLADRHRHTDSTPHIADTIRSIRNQCAHIDENANMDPTLVMEEVLDILKSRGIPYRRYNL